jgi:putative phosphoesterase
MEIGVMSDSHGNLELTKNAMIQMGEVDLIIHLGDYVRDALYLSNLTDIPIHSIKGNMDTKVNDDDEFFIQKVDGYNVFGCHGHQYGVKNDLKMLKDAGKKENADIILFGHTHQACVEYDGKTLIMNPGSIGHPRINLANSFGIITIEEGECIPRIIEIIR